MAPGSRRRSPLGLALSAVGAGGLLLGGMQIVLVDTAGVADPWWAPVLGVVVAWVYLGAGLLAWWRRPANRIGPLIVAGGVSLLLSDLANTGVPALVVAGTIAATVPLAVVVHLLHAFPSGRLRGGVSYATVIAGYAVSLLGQAPLYLYNVAAGNPLAIADRPDLARVGGLVQAGAGAAVMLVTTVILGGRLRRADGRQRRILGPVYGYGILAVLSIPLIAQVARPLLRLGDSQVGALQLAVVAGIPVAFTLGVLHGGFVRTGQIEELGTWLSRADAARPQLTTALARTLGDDSLQMLFWSPSGYLDAAGSATGLPAPGSNRAAVEFEVEGRRVAAIVYDTLLIGDPEPVRAAGRVAAIALAHELLTAELRAGEEELRRSRARIVEAGDRERRRIARNLHDGLQVRMVLLSMNAQQVAADPAASVVTQRAAALRTGIDEAAAELRTLVHEVMPAALIERGLCAATEDLVDRMPLPTRLQLDVTDGQLPAGLESTAYFVIAEGLTNALKHAGAHQLAVRLALDGGRLVVEIDDDGAGGATPSGGTGLHGLADRVDTLGGTFTLSSPVGAGTRLVVTLPCGS